MEPIECSKYGLWQTSVCVSCQTTHFHTENDCTYTVICVPQQEVTSGKNSSYNFMIQLKSKMNIGFKLEEGLSFIHSGKYLTHKQMLNENTNDKNDVFINLASYGNEKLYNHLRATIKRKANHKKLQLLNDVLI